jgi:hypothetical protein
MKGKSSDADTPRRPQDVKASEQTLPTEISPPTAPAGPRRPGAMKGLIDIGPEFFEPLPEEELKAWEGEA